MAMKAKESLEASLDRKGYLRLSMNAAYALGQTPVDAATLGNPQKQLRISLEWDRERMALTLRGGEEQGVKVARKKRTNRRRRPRRRPVNAPGARPRKGFEQ